MGIHTILRSIDSGEFYRVSENTHDGAFLRSASGTIEWFPASVIARSFSVIA
jgi:hypothetical protein